MRSLFIFGILFCLVSSVAFAQDREQAKQALIERLKSDLAAEREKAILRRQILVAEQMLSKDFETAVAVLELSDEQIAEYHDVREEFSARIKDEVRELPGYEKPDFDQIFKSSEFRELDNDDKKRLEAIRNGYADALSKIYIDNQLKQLSAFHLSSGLPKLLVLSPMGGMLDLTDSQKENIQAKSQSLAEEIDEFTAKIRKRSREIISSELTDEQWEKLQDYVGEDMIQQYPGRRIPIELIGDWYRFHSAEGK